MTPTDDDGVRYIRGRHHRYAIDSLTWTEDRTVLERIDHHIQRVWAINPRHEDLDLLLDARNEETNP